VIRLKNWFIENRLYNDYQAPELGDKVLVGQVYGHSSHADGTFIRTSRIVRIEDMGDHKDIFTISGSQYSVFPEDVNPEAEKVFPGYYERLSIKEV